MSPQVLSKQEARSTSGEKTLKSPPSSVSDISQQDAESIRGRRQDRDTSDGGRDDEASGGEDESQTSPKGNGQHRKRKRSRKGLDKKFNCPHDGCGKSYSRAEHLYRHQLNRESALSR